MIEPDAGASRLISQTEPLPRELAGCIARLTSTANLRPDAVDRARRRNADRAHQGRATVAVALHAPTTMVGKGARNAIEIAVALGREAGPVAGERAARPAAPAERGRLGRPRRNPLDALRQVHAPRAGDASGGLLNRGAVRSASQLRVAAGDVDHICAARSKGGSFHLKGLGWIAPEARCGLETPICTMKVSHGGPMDLAVRACRA